MNTKCVDIYVYIYMCICTHTIVNIEHVAN